MDNKYDRESRVREQYKSSDNLEARIRLHTYNTNKMDWNKWFFEKMDIPDHSRILELGCGNGILWSRNLNSISNTWDITLSDLSEGMLESSEKNINNNSFKYKVVDIQGIPYEDESFDIVIARHMLYHVLDLNKALTEVSRVLKPKGKFYTSTNSRDNMHELKMLIENYDHNTDFNPEKLANRFGLENGSEILEGYFAGVIMEEFGGQIVVDEAEPVVSYIASTIGYFKEMYEKNKLDNLHEYIEGELCKAGVLKITTKSCMFTAWK